MKEAVDKEILPTASQLIIEFLLTINNLDSEPSLG